MPQQTSTQQFQIGGMTCTGCQSRIQSGLQSLPGVESAQVSYSRGTAKVTFDPAQTSREQILQAVQALGYTTPAPGQDSGKGAGRNNAAGILLILLAGYLLLRRMGILTFFNIFPQAEAGMGYGLLFLTGLLTSVHCVAMCGGISLSQCLPAGEGATAKPDLLRPSLLYNLGRVISYTAVGALVGALGSVISFSGAAKGLVQLVAGVFMVIMGLNMLGFLPQLRRFVPRLPAFLSGGCQGKGQGRGPLVVGLLNGLMPCGPLQAMQLYALSTGSAVQGALSMLLFSLGTVPLLLGLGALSTLLGSKYTKGIMTAGAALVVVLGASMFSSGLALSGFGVAAAAGAEAQAAQVEPALQTVETQLSPRGYPAITVVEGIPVRWVINAAPGTINGCNNRLFIPEYGIEKQLQVGENIIEFTPTRTGTFVYSCWMGMIRSTITVTGSDGTVPEAAEDTAGGLSDPYQYFSAPQPAGYQIPTESLAVAAVEDGVQQVEITLTDESFEPAVVVLQAGLETRWSIHNNSRDVQSILFPVYGTGLGLVAGENTVSLLATGDFDFLADDGAFYGYVKVVEDIESFDAEAVRQEVSSYETHLPDSSGGMGCCG